MAWNSEGMMGMAPNRKSVVQQVSDADPARFRRAHTGQPGEDDWIRAVAATLHAEDPKWGLNGKGGDPNVISLDVVTYRVGPTDRHVEAFDICGACGGGNPSVVWNDITNYATMGQPGTAIWVRPEGVTPDPDPDPDPIPPPSNQPVLEAIAALGAALGQLRADVGRVEALAQRAAFESLNAASRCSEIKTQIENLPAGKPFPVYTGRIPVLGTVTLIPREP